MNSINPLLLTDGYKLGHHAQYPPNTTMVYSNWTPRGSRIPEINRVVVLGLQAFIKKYLIEGFRDGFFDRPRTEVVSEYRAYINKYLGSPQDVSHIEDLHQLGFLPLRIRALPEGVSVPLRVPMFTIRNTIPRFYWVTNYIETLLSNSMWQFSTSATIARRMREVLMEGCMRTDPENKWFVDWQGHDFSMRGMGGIDGALYSGTGHASAFLGSDTVPVMWFLSKYYRADTRDCDTVIGSVPATEHSVMCAGGQETEVETIRRLLRTYPKGILSIVSDTWDLWKVCTHHLSTLKDEIMQRDGKLVIRPDSGDPVKIVCGDPDAPEDSNANLGVVQLLWDTFGGTETSTGYKKLDSHIGVIYGDSITLDRAKAIIEGLATKGFASTNIVFGIGSYTYNLVSRDVFGFAMKATACVVNGEFHELYKDPVTDDGLKRSARGLIKIEKRDGVYVMLDRQNYVGEHSGELRTVFEDGRLLIDEHWSLIRQRIQNNE